MNAPYAITAGVFTKREFPIEPHPFRDDFQRDRDRIVHSRAFRRLEYKTQVFVNHLGDNYRTRLTHSIEVAQISRTVARSLALNEDLCETIALAHDLGHPPFGHAGEHALHNLMKGHGGFEHNKQTLRVVTLLEDRYPEYQGLNLMQITLMGLQKHEHLPAGLSHSLEAQIVDFCDEIAYNNHDVDDGIDSQFLTINDLDQVTFWRKSWQAVNQRYPQASEHIKVHLTVRRMTDLMVTDLVQNIKHNLAHYNVNTVGDVLAFHRDHPNHDLVCYSNELSPDVLALKKFLMHHLYRHPRVVKMNDYAHTTIEKIFNLLLQKPQFLPPEYATRVNSEGIHRVIADFIAGMTDRYATRWLSDHEK